MKNINHKDSFFLSRKAPTFASGNSNPRIRGMRFLQRKEAKQLVNINYYNGSKSETNKQISSFLFILWAGGAALLSYSLVYALRKPFTAATFDGMDFFGMDYKVATTIMQIFGYLISKFFAIKIVSELKRETG